MKRVPHASSRASHVHSRRPRPRAPAAESFARAAALFRAAGDVARLRLLHLLGQGEWCVTELAAVSGTKLSTLSQQLRVLYSARIVERRREGKHIYYRLADEHVRALVHAALEHASEG
jgi:ArsR family transcriptional regulator, lead/cadmium/zinc/bismuth-responsive transcriptional repressor